MGRHNIEVAHTLWIVRGLEQDVLERRQIVGAENAWTAYRGVKAVVDEFVRSGG